MLSESLIRYVTTKKKTNDAAWSNYIPWVTQHSATEDQHKMNVKRKDEVGVVEINLREFAARERRVTL